MTLRLAPAPAMSDFLERAAASSGSPAGGDWSEPLHCGIDLGTATIVLAVVDDEGEPVYWDAVASSTVRDGVVVDFHGAAESVAHLKERAEAVLGRTLERAATAYPPGVGANESRACQFV
ncbi:MAG TPA: ethanolamine utilization protein EutJ, partial [Acidimicrobiia bacterium]|nr:ethanolamine utilization protein EutJ [Acidimicrobiia bacterium]